MTFRGSFLGREEEDEEELDWEAAVADVEEKMDWQDEARVRNAWNLVNKVS